MFGLINKFIGPTKNRFTKTKSNAMHSNKHKIMNMFIELIQPLGINKCKN